MFYGVFIAKEVDGAEDTGSRDTTRDVPLINRILMTNLFVLSKDDLFTHYMFCCKSFDIVGAKYILHSFFVQDIPLCYKIEKQ